MHSREVSKSEKIEMISVYKSAIVLSLFVIALGQNCKLSSGKTGYCRKKEECYSLSEKSDCKNKMFCCQNSDKSITKCKDYGKYVYRKAFNGALTARTFVHDISECKIEAIPLIVGGLKAKAKEFPHMVAIGYGNDIKRAKWMCGGSLISENFILTAAHCSKSEGGVSPKFVRIGTLNLNNPGDSNYQDFTIAEIINHPKYNPPSRYNDIALYKLSSSVEINGYARPACLHTTPDEFTFKKFMATGWGKLDYNANEGSEDLMKVALNFVDFFKCNSSFSSDIGGFSLRKGIISSQICAGELKGGKDTCQGDSGGPLQIVKDDPYCMYSIVGITSFGKFCGFKNSPAVYTRVSYFVPWIESIVWS